MVHISCLKPCYPRAQDLEVQERQRIMDIFKEESDDEDFLGFPDNSFSTSSRGWLPGPTKEPDNCENFSEPSALSQD